MIATATTVVRVITTLYHTAGPAPATAPNATHPPIPARDGAAPPVNNATGSATEHAAAAAAAVPSTASQDSARQSCSKPDAAAVRIPHEIHIELQQSTSIPTDAVAIPAASRHPEARISKGCDSATAAQPAHAAAAPAPTRA